MERPFASSRPVGPFVSRNDSSSREFDAVEITINDDHEPEKYNVAGVLKVAPESVGLVIDTAAVTVNGASLAMWEYKSGNPSSEVVRGQSGVEITAPSEGSVKIHTANAELVEIEI